VRVRDEGSFADARAGRRLFSCTTPTSRVWRRRRHGALDLIAKHARRPFWLAGGLTPQNVGDAIAAVHPDGVDVASGVESAPGIKDERKVHLFVASVRASKL